MLAASQSQPHIGAFDDAAVRHAERPNGDRLTWVEGLAEALTACYERLALPSELAYLWARPGRPVELAALRSAEGLP